MGLKLKVATSSSTQNLRKQKITQKKYLGERSLKRNILFIHIKLHSLYFLCALYINVYNFSVELPFASVAFLK